MQPEAKNKYRQLNRNAIKCMALFFMVLNHISTIFLEEGTLVAQLLLDLGYFTAITMCYFLVEGFAYTHSRKKYATRLLVFALISELPYCLAFTSKGILEFQNFNMLFTLLICFGILTVIHEKASSLSKFFSIAGLILVSTLSDWPLLAPIFTLLFFWSRGSRKKTTYAFLLSTLIFGFVNFLTGTSTMPLSKNIVSALGSMIGPALAGIVILFLYNGEERKGKRNDKMGKEECRGKSLSKWFFYLFYPLHLLILGLIRIFH